MAAFVVFYDGNVRYPAELRNFFCYIWRPPAFHAHSIGYAETILTNLALILT